MKSISKHFKEKCRQIFERKWPANVWNEKKNNKDIKGYDQPVSKEKDQQTLKDMDE